jgi:hypothetical protein
LRARLKYLKQSNRMKLSLLTCIFPARLGRSLRQRVALWPVSTNNFPVDEREKGATGLQAHSSTG